jgi:hypothetical protein
MFPADGGGSAQLSQSETHASTSKSRPLNPRSSLDDYNRVILEYTRRRMSTFADVDGPPRHTSAGRTRSNTRENNSTTTTSTTDSDSSTGDALVRHTVPTVGDADGRAAGDSRRS